MVSEKKSSTADAATPRNEALEVAVRVGIGGVIVGALAARSLRVRSLAVDEVNAQVRSSPASMMLSVRIDHRLVHELPPPHVPIAAVEDPTAMYEMVHSLRLGAWRLAHPKHE